MDNQISLFEDNDCFIDGELHHVIPVKFLNGNSVRCRDCRYYVAYSKKKVTTGECHSVAQKKRKGYIHSKGDFDLVDDFNSCSLFYEKKGENNEADE